MPRAALSTPLSARCAKVMMTFAKTSLRGLMNAFAKDEEHNYCCASLPQLITMQTHSIVTC